MSNDTLPRPQSVDGPDEDQVRESVKQGIAENPPQKGGILAALRRSPMVGANLDLSRPK